MRKSLPAVVVESSRQILRKKWGRIFEGFRTKKKRLFCNTTTRKALEMISDLLCASLRAAAAAAAAREIRYNLNLNLSLSNHAIDSFLRSSHLGRFRGEV